MNDNELEASGFEKEPLKKDLNSYKEEIDQLKMIVMQSKNGKFMININLTRKFYL